MYLTYDAWPFRPIEQRSLQETQQWWQHCYVSSAADALLPGHPNWSIVTGGPGSGKSVALAALAQQEQGQSFIIPYPPEKWPGASGAWLRQESSHLAQMMATAAMVIRDYLDQNHEQLDGLRGLQREFLRWLLERVGGDRAYRRWLYGLPADLAEPFEKTQAVEDLFVRANDPADIQGQIDELVHLVRAFGYQRLVFTVDADSIQPQQMGRLTDLFGWLDLTYHPGFTLVAAIPLQIIRQGEVVGRSRGRVSVISLDWTVEECWYIAERHIGLALAAQETDVNPSLSEYATPDLLAEMSQLIQREYGDQTPAGWVALAETMLFLTCRTVKPLPRPLTKEDAGDVKRTFFQRHMLLRLDDSNHGVWRGPRFIPLDEQPLRFLSLLHRRAGRPVNWEDRELQNFAGSKANVHSLASRVRAAVEPEPKRWVYVLNSRGGGGYWLENSVR